MIQNQKHIGCLLEEFKEQCGSCSNCCLEEMIFLNKQDVIRLSKNLSIPIKKFILRYTQELTYKNKNVFKLNNSKNECIFLKDGQCSVYEDRPDMCKNFPFYLEEDELWISQGYPCHQVDDFLDWINEIGIDYKARKTNHFLILSLC